MDIFRGWNRSKSSRRAPSSSSRFSLILMLSVMASLVVTVQGSWYEWFWAPEAPFDSCRAVIAYAYNASQFSVDLTSYLAKAKLVSDPNVAAGISALVSFLHEKSSPCIKSQLGSTSPLTTEPSWKERITNLLTSYQFVLALPGILAFIIIIGQCIAVKLCQKKNYRLLKKK